MKTKRREGDLHEKQNKERSEKTDLLSLFDLAIKNYVSGKIGKAREEAARGGKQYSQPM